MEWRGDFEKQNVHRTLILKACSLSWPWLISMSLLCVCDARMLRFSVWHTMLLCRVLVFSFFC